MASQSLTVPVEVQRGHQGGLHLHVKLHCNPLFLRTILLRWKCVLDFTFVI